MTNEKVSGGGSGEMRAATTAPRISDHKPEPVAPAASPDPRAFRRTMGLLATGVTVITTRMNGSIHGMTANSVTSVSLDPLLMLVAINRCTSMCNIIQQAGEFAINILSERQEELSRHFAGPKTGPQPAGLRFESGSENGAPCLYDALAAFRCRIERVLDGGDHVIVLGRVVHFQDGPPAQPLLYFGDRYGSFRELEVPSPPAVRNHDADQIFYKASTGWSRRASHGADSTAT